MSYLSIIKVGIHAVNRNWQLVLIQLLFMILSFMSFFFIVGLPIAIAFILFGLDLTEILRLKDVLSALKGSTELLQRYFGVAVLVLLSLLFYIAFIVVLSIFTFAGTTGLLTKSIREEDLRFSLTSFFGEGRRLFLPLLLFSFVIGAIFITVALILGVIGSTASAIIETARAYEATLALFLGVFFSLILLSLGLFLILLTLSVAVYGLAFLAFNTPKPFDALRGTIRYLISRPSSVWFYGLLLFGYMVTGFVVILIGSPLTFIPGIGSLLSLPYQLVSYVIQGYISLVMLSATFYYYFTTGYSPSVPESTVGSGTSPLPVEEPSPAPEEKVEPPQG